MRRAFRVLLLLVPIATSLSNGPISRAATADVTGFARVIDGDTLVIGDRTVRLLGVDAPEEDQTCQSDMGQGWPCGVAARQALIARVGHDTVSCELNGTDRYGRDLGRCTAKGSDLGAWLVRAGWAIPYGDGQGRYAAARRDAEARRKGLWVGSFTPPAEWRRARRQARSKRTGG